MGLSTKKNLLPFVRVGLLSYWIALVVGTHVPGQALSPTFSSHDKMLHLTAYSLLAAVCFLWLSLEGWSIRTTTFGLLPALIFHGALDEVTQLPVPGRFADTRDWAADCAGVATGLVASVALVLCVRGLWSWRARMENT